MTIQYVDWRDTKIILATEYEATCVPELNTAVVISRKAYNVRYVERWAELQYKGGVMVRVDLAETGHEVQEPLLP